MQRLRQTKTKRNGKLQYFTFCLYVSIIAYRKQQEEYVNQKTKSKYLSVKCSYLSTALFSH